MTRRFTLPMAMLLMLCAADATAQNVPIEDDGVSASTRRISFPPKPLPPPVDTTPFDVGGLRYVILPAGFEVDTPAFVRIEANQVVLPYDSRIRPGCFLSSPWLPIEHDKGIGDFIPNMQIDWTGILFPLSGYHSPIVTLQAAVRHADGRIEYHRQAIDSGRLPRLEPVFRLSPEATLVHGVTDNDLLSRRATQALAVAPGDTVRVSLCDAMEGTELRIRSFVFQSNPIGQE